MSNSNKAAYSSAIRAEIKRHENLQSTFNKLLKQLERVEDQQLKIGLKVYIHSIQGERFIGSETSERAPAPQHSTSLPLPVSEWESEDETEQIARLQFSRCVCRLRS
ncbi:hypothetical protein P4O66_020873 [Electrophorus voltai]|uniref:Uncharacterized protein n=1 Tax=Electrophorus voltai TaxID=2609070 RepID=A0AAD9E3V2_9TELE|nr:hypothetical protein P4O66_020873 [Electrophorus voltai]